MRAATAPPGARCFAALMVPEPARTALAPAVEALGGDPALRAVPPDALHVTLRFLGALAPMDEARARSALDQVAARAAPFSLALSPRWGAFPSLAAAQVLWMAVAGDLDALSQLAGDARAATRELGQAPKGPFVPHVTVARVRGRRPIDLRRIVEALPVTQEVRWTVERLVSYHSHLGPSGARYEAVAWHDLGGARRLSSREER